MILLQAVYVFKLNININLVNKLNAEEYRNQTEYKES